MKKIRVILITIIIIITASLCGCNDQNNNTINNNHNNTINDGNNKTNEKPIAIASVNTNSGFADLTDFFFSSDGSYDSDGEIIYYKWNLGDENIHVSDQNPIHTYSEPGTYIVKLWVEDDDNTWSDPSIIVITVS